MLVASHRDRSVALLQSHHHVGEEAADHDRLGELSSCPSDADNVVPLRAAQ